MTMSVVRSIAKVPTSFLWVSFISIGLWQIPDLIRASSDLSEIHPAVLATQGCCGFEACTKECG